MIFLTAMEQAFINDGATSAEALANAEAKENANLIEKINSKLELVANQVARECFEEALRAVPELPNRQMRRHTLETILQNIETKLMFQHL